MANEKKHTVLCDPVNFTNGDNHKTAIDEIKIDSRILNAERKCNKESNNSKETQSVVHNTLSDSKPDFEKLTQMFEDNPECIESWIKEKAPIEVINRIQEMIVERRKIQREFSNIDLFQQWLSASPSKYKVCLING